MTNPEGLATDASGDVFVVDSGDFRVQKWVLTVAGNVGAHTKETVYYTAKEEASLATCRNHPEWANLPCVTRPAAQPGVSGTPELPATEVKSYNMWDEPLITVETVGSSTRTKTKEYDSVGREIGSEVSGTVGSALSKVSYQYSTETGALTTQSTKVGGATKTITLVSNTLGQLGKYTDASGNTSTYVYDVDGRVEEMSDGRGTQMYAYDPTTGLLTKLLDTAAGTFTATYDTEGKLTSEVYPNGMCANTSYNATGTATNLQYIKTRNCTEKEPPLWLSDAIVPSIHGEVLQQTSTLAKDNYAYDAAGRLVEVKETPSGQSCTTRLYTYDEDANRATETVRPSGTETCAASGGTTEWHTYDTADRLTDKNITYNGFGNLNYLPAADNGGHALKSNYYSDNQIQSQEQEEKKITYLYDPTGRSLETETVNGSSKATVSYHYAGPGESFAWTSEGAEKWTRNIPGIGGALSATQTSGSAPVLQLPDLMGNIIATAATSESETKLLSTYSSTEFGVPQSGTIPPRYSWLGSTGLSSELPTTGVVTTGASSYVPLVGRALQTESTTIPGGAFPDARGNAGEVRAPYIGSLNGELKTIAEQHEGELQAAARRKAEEESARNACPASECGPFPTEGGAEEAGEETFGDPVHCYVGGQLVQENEHAGIFGWGGCNEDLPSGTWIKACVQDLPDLGVTPFNKCNQEVLKHKSKYEAIGDSAAEHCSEGDLLRGYVAFYVPGGRTLYAGVDQTECVANDESVWEALSPWSALPGELDI